MPTRGGALLVVLSVLAAACTSGGSDGDRQRSPVPDPKPGASSASVPFVVEGIPDELMLLAAGRGDARHDWGEDCCGTDEPYTYLKRTDGSGRLVRVAKVGYQGSDDKPALWQPAASDPNSWWEWARLSVDQGDGLAITVSGDGATRAELESVYRSIDLDRSHETAPALGPPPRGFAVVGSVDAEGVLGLLGGMVEPGWNPGAARSHGAGWRGGSSELTVVTVPGRSLSVPAAAADAASSSIGDPLMTARLRTVAGRKVMVRQAATQSFGARSTVAWDAPWGDVVVVSSSVEGVARSPLLSIDELIRIARSVRPATPVEWRTFVAAVAAPDDIVADPGRTEIARGKVGAVGWLLQTAAPDPSNFLGRDAGYDGAEVPDRCLKLSTGEQACAAYTETFAEGVLRVSEDPRLTVIITTTPAASYRLTGGGFPSSTGQMVPVPGGKLWAGVSQTTNGQFWCRDPALDPSLDLARLDLIDAAGSAVGCVGQP